MGTPLRGARIPHYPGGSLDHWAAEKCELCGHELGYDHSIRLGHGGMGYHHAVCGAKYATHMLLKIRENPEQAAELAQLADGSPDTFWAWLADEYGLRRRLAAQGL